MTVFSVKKITRLLQDRRLDVVAEATGIGYRTLVSLRSGSASEGLRLDTAAKLTKYFKCNAVFVLRDESLDGMDGDDE